MLTSNAKGMKTYLNTLQSCRANGAPIGPQHHLYNRQRKAWDAQSHKRHQKIRENEQAIKTLEIKLTALEAHKQARMAQSLKFDDRTGHIKSNSSKII